MADRKTPTTPIEVVPLVASRPKSQQQGQGSVQQSKMSSANVNSIKLPPADEAPPPPETTQPWGSQTLQPRTQSLRSIMREEQESVEPSQSQEDILFMRVLEQSRQESCAAAVCDQNEAAMMEIALSRSMMDVTEEKKQGTPGPPHVISPLQSLSPMADVLSRRGIQELPMSLPPPPVVQPSPILGEFGLRVREESETAESIIESPHDRRKRILIKPGSQRSLKSVGSCVSMSSVRSESTCDERKLADIHVEPRPVSQKQKNARLPNVQSLETYETLEERASDGDLASVSEGQSCDNSTPPVVAAVAQCPPSANLKDAISPEDSAAIEQALLDLQNADAAKANAAENEARSLQLALFMVEQDKSEAAINRRNKAPQGNVRTLTRGEFQAEQRVGAFRRSSPPRVRHPLEEQERLAAGFRLNSNAPQQWTRIDRNTIVGPNNEVRTKHDSNLLGRANADRLGLDTDADDEEGVMVGNRAYNSFIQSVRKTKKGVAVHGSGRAGSDAGGTKSGAMDSNVRLVISRAVNSGLIEKCNGIVKEGKEAVVYHAVRGSDSGHCDIAVKVFKRIQQFRSRGDYVEGDPRYSKNAFSAASARDQLALWTEKEFRNLTRAHRAGIPVPTPYLRKQNVLFMRFLGADGWPAPQLRELELRVGSKRWIVLYHQVVDALYRDARLVHGDVSEYNILVVPAGLVENTSPDLADDDLQAVLIDFGQAVDIRHPHAQELFDRDFDRVRSFFRRVGLSEEDMVKAAYPSRQSHGTGDGVEDISASLPSKVNLI